MCPDQTLKLKKMVNIEWIYSTSLLYALNLKLKMQLSLPSRAK